MSASKVIINYENEADSDLVIITKQIVGGCTDNKDFNFTKSELINLSTYLADFESRLSVMPTGGVMETEWKTQSRNKLLSGLHIICLEINAQQSGNTVALQGSGAPLTGSSTYSGGYPAPEGLKIKPVTSATELDVSVKRVDGLHDHGTMFAITEFTGAPDDINLWTMKYSSSHHLKITGLKPGTKYLLAAGFQGTTGTPIVWCKPIIVGTSAA